jgi:hypothetical protein
MSMDDDFVILIVCGMVEKMGGFGLFGVVFKGRLINKITGFYTQIKY